ncbi:replication factor RFC1 C terminal domain-containing protein [Mycena metata]|uniref:Replication factor C subunit 1 n=1 Tax=Mycena metata TaxID=1033252 RepID=A0AAD7HCL4_9AGAR|nr:replication factor RFC1 C terminal domain-containing protein [Mycena metata]
MAPSQKAAKPAQSNGKDIRAFFGGPASQKATPKPAESKKPSQKADTIEILDSDDEPMPSVQQASSSKAVAKSSPVAPKEEKKPTLGAGPRKSAPAALKPMDVDSDDEPVVKKRKKATALLSSDDDEDTPPKKKAAAGTSKPKPRLSKAEDDDFVVSDDDEAPARKTTSRRASTQLFLPSDDEDEDEAPKKKPAPSKPRPSKSKKDGFIVSSDEDEPAPKKATAKPKPKATTSKPPAKAAATTKGKEKVKEEKVKEEPAKEKFNWAAARAAKLAGPSAPGSKAVPDGEPNCLAGLALVFTGELSSFSREESVEIAKRYGARVPTQPSSKTDYVVLGDNAGPSKLTAIKKHGLRTLDEDGFLHLIATRKGSGQFDEKTSKKMQKDKEAIETAAKEMEKREKKEAKEASSGSSKIDPSSQLWTTRYAPQNIKEICGNKTQVERLQQWLQDWPKSLKSGFKKPGPNGMNVYRAVLISGPPGIGKTTSAHMVAKLEGFTPIELNASDARSKKLVENGMNVNNKSLDGYIGGSRERDGVTITDRTVLIMDEVDGMSAGDRGGVGALTTLIKKSKVPIICIANDGGAQKLKPLKNNVFSMTFQRPQAQAIRSRLMTIAFKEKMQVPANVLDQLVQSSQSDIRQVLNMLSTWRLSNRTMNFDEGKSLAQMNEKYTVMSPFDITSKVMGPKLFASNSRATLNDKMELYFQDHSLVPLMIQENYLKSEPMRLKNYDGPMKILKSLELMDNAASSISDGDLVDALIHGPEQHWGLMPLHAVCSTIRPASFMYGMGVHWGGNNPMSFPAWLGQNSKQSKLNRQLGEVQIRMRLKVSGDKSEIRQSYIPALFPHIVKPLMDVGASAVEEVIKTMDDYYLTKEDWDAIVELGVDDKKDEFVLKKISTATKTNLTKKYNASEHPIPFYKADAGKAPKKLPGGPAPDLDDVFDIDEPIEDASDDDKGSQDADDDISKDKMIKAPKKKGAKAKAAPKTTKAKK